MNGPSLCPAAVRANPTLAQWLHVPAEGPIEVRSGKVELGQGIGTALLQIACDCLGLEPEQIVLCCGDTHDGPDEGYTAGSLSMQQGGAALRWACEHAYELFATAAAHVLEIEQDRLIVECGRFQVEGSDASVSYRELTASVDLRVRIDELPAQQRRQSSRPWVGRDLPRFDLPAKLSGAAYVQDLELPGMLHARVLRPHHPSQGLAGPLTQALEQLQALPGVTQVVASGNFIALVGPHEGRLVRAVGKARQLLQWTAATTVVADSEIGPLLRGLPSIDEVLLDHGSTQAGEQHLQAQYTRPYLAHASIGPCCAVATHSGGVLRVWSHSQGVYPLREALSRALDLNLDEVRVTHLPGAGCYGHNGADDVAFDAAFIALRTNAPVRVQWMREDEMCAGPAGSAGAMSLCAGLRDGRIVEWSAEVWSHSFMQRPGWCGGVNLLGAWQVEPPQPPLVSRDIPLPSGGGHRNALAIYALPHQHVQYHFVPESPLRVSALRSLGAHSNLFAIESFMDELASLAGCDPLEFRLRHLQDERARAVLMAVAANAGWAERPTGGDGHGWGLAFGRYKNVAAYCAVVVRVAVEERVRVVQAFVAVDAGTVVSPDGVRNQVEGGLVQALSWTLKEAMHWDETGITSRDWASYPILGFEDVPDVRVTLLDPVDGSEATQRPSLGVGEVMPGPVSAAVANALFDALGLRLRDLPLTPERIIAAMDAQ